MENFRIETDRILIRRHAESDWKDLYEYLSLEEIYLYEPGQPVTEEEARNITLERTQGNDFYAVVLKEENKMIGHLYFHQTEPEKFMTWELGYIFNPGYRNRGFCTEASKRIIQYAFHKLQAHKIVAYCNPENTASWRVLEKTGMVREGFFKQKAFFRLDKNNLPLWHDCYAYGILNNE